MEKEITLDAEVKNRVILWFLPYTPEEVLIMGEDVNGETLNLTLTHAFDYEEIGRNRWRMHIDIGFDLKPIAKIKTRLTYEIKCKKSLLFHPASIDLTNKMALELAQDAFIDSCKEEQIEVPILGIENIEEYAKGLSKGMIELAQYRFKDDEINPKGNVGLITISPGTHTMLLVQGTFFILDEVLHSNKVFDLEHNQEVFHEVIPEPIYYTLKLNCMALEEGTIKLKFRENIFFQICIDCTLQLLLHDHFEKLLPIMMEGGFDEASQKEYISFANKYLTDLRESYQKSGATITNLQTRYDWNSMLK
ncbi:MAG: hypothetical protein WCH34_02045 [Bacteroidota bacterium]